MKNNITAVTCSRFWAALSPAISIAASTTVCRLNTAELSTSLLASMRLKSRMSVINVSNVSPEHLADRHRTASTHTVCHMSMAYWKKQSTHPPQILNPDCHHNCKERQA